MPILVKRAGFEDLLNSGEYFLKALIIGENGSGKTPFAAQWPKPLFALCENGHMSLALSNTPYADVKSSADMQALLDTARIESRKPIASRQYQTFVVDTIDSYQKILIQERLRETKQQSLTGWADWGWLDGKMQSLIEQLKSLAMNVVVLMHTRDVHEKDDEDSDSTRVVQRARMKGDSKDSIFDNYPLVGLMENSYGAEKGERVMKRHVRWQADPKHPNLRDQSTRLPKLTEVRFEPADFQQLMDAIAPGLDDIAKSEVVQEIATPEPAVVEPITDVPEVGALDNPSLPKAAAKKAAAKKTAAKKAAPAKETPVETSSPAQDTVVATTATPSGIPSASAPVTEPSAGEVARFASGGSVGDDPWQPSARSEEPAPAPSTSGLKICGTQPQPFIGKHDAAPGCGNEIPADDLKSKISIVKHRTHLCGNCADRADQLKNN